VSEVGYGTVTTESLPATTYDAVLTTVLLEPLAVRGGGRQPGGQLDLWHQHPLRLGDVRLESVLRGRAGPARFGDQYDAPIRRNVSTGGAGRIRHYTIPFVNHSIFDGTDGRLYAEQDANYNVTSVADNTGRCGVLRVRPVRKSQRAYFPSSGYSTWDIATTDRVLVPAPRDPI